MRHRGLVELDKRAVGIAVVAVAVGVALGYWSGAVPGVAAALAGLIPAVILQIALNRQGSSDSRREWLAQAETAFASRVITVAADAGKAGDGAAGGVAQYLRPEAEVVGFWPRPELDEILAWVTSAARVAIRLVTGPGGSGKTRLTRELCEQAAGLGWRSYWVPMGREAEAVRVARAGEVPVLLVADYAETRPGLPEMLAAVADCWDGPSVRIVLLARSAGEWWQRLLDSTPEEANDMLVAGQPVKLGPVADRSGQQTLFDEALAAFASLRGIACPEAQLRLSDPDAVVLVVHAAALLAVLDAEVGGIVDSSAARLSSEEVLDGLLRHERRYWHHSLANRVAVVLDPDVTERVVTAGCLIGSEDQEAATRMLAVIEDLADAQLRGTLSRWLHDLYPVPATAAGQEWIGQLQPDLLTERLVVTVLERHRELIPRLFAGLNPARARRALTILGRAALTQPDALDQIQMALHAHPDHLLVAAVTVTIETNPALAIPITAVCAAAPLPAATLTAVARAIPYPTVVLAALNAAVTRQIVDTLPPGTPPADRAEWLNSLGIALSQLGRPAEALPVTQETVAVRRELAAANPARYRPDLAESLNNLGVMFSALGRRTEALSVTQETVAIYRELAAATPDLYRPYLATALNNLSNRLSDLGRRADALPVSQETVAVYLELAAAKPDRYLPGLARALANLGITFSRADRLTESLAVEQKAVAVYRELAAANPDRYRPDLANILNNLGVTFSALDRSTEALQVTEEAVAIYRDLAAANPDRYRPDLANSLNNLGRRVSPLDRSTEALQVAEEAVAIYRNLAAANPDRYRPDLADSLNTLSVTQWELGRWAEALLCTEEAAAAYRELIATDPDRHRALARVVEKLDAFLTQLERTGVAEEIRKGTTS